MGMEILERLMMGARAKEGGERFGRGRKRGAVI